MTADEDLVTSEGVDEGSAASTAGGTDPAAVIGRPTHGSPGRESDPAPPPLDDGPAGPARPGQELSEGEG